VIGRQKRDADACCKPFVVGERRVDERKRGMCRGDDRRRGAVAGG